MKVEIRCLEDVPSPLEVSSSVGSKVNVSVFEDDDDNIAFVDCHGFVMC